VTHMDPTTRIRMVHLVIRRLKWAALAMAMVWAFNPHLGLAQSITVGPDKEFRVQKLSVPFAFYNESFGAAAGYVYGITGYPQKQASLLTTVMAGTRGSAMAFLIAKDVQIPWFERWFTDGVFSIGRFGEIESFSDGNRKFIGERAGSNDSDKDNFIDGDGWDNYFRLKFKYLLPIGHGRDTVVNTYVLERGHLIEGRTGGTSWNPMESGRTYLEIKPFYRSQTIETYRGDFDNKTNGLELALFRDNTDFALNPSEGSALRLRLNKDWGWLNSDAPWTVVDGEFSKYFSLGSSERFIQRVFAFDVWTADCVTWNESHKENGKKVYHRAPPFAGATLGGLFRMRGYPTGRFNDKSAVYYSLEYRLTPKWNPFPDIPWVQKALGIAWWQWVPFVEVGRVASEWDIRRLHSDMKWDAGFGIRGMAKGLVVRIDTAASPEGFGVQMMIAQPFQF
jgi:hypothetical protein